MLSCASSRYDIHWKFGEHERRERVVQDTMGNLSTIGSKTVDKFAFSTPYFTVILFALLACAFNPNSPKNVVWQLLWSWATSKQHWMGEQGLFHSLLHDKEVVLFGALKVLMKDNESTNYVADCSFWSTFQTSQGHHNSMMNSWKHESVIILHLSITCGL